MNNNYFNNPTFPPKYQEAENNKEKFFYQPPDQNNNNYINDKYDFKTLLKSNKGKLVKIFITSPNYTAQDNIDLSGIIEEVGNDYITISNPSNGKWYLTKLTQINYIEFEESIN